MSLSAKNFINFNPPDENNVRRVSYLKIDALLLQIIELLPYAEVYECLTIHVYSSQQLEELYASEYFSKLIALYDKLEIVYPPFTNTHQTLSLHPDNKPPKPPKPLKNITRPDNKPLKNTIVFECLP